MKWRENYGWVAQVISAGWMFLVKWMIEVIKIHKIPKYRLICTYSELYTRSQCDGNSDGCVILLIDSNWWRRVRCGEANCFSTKQGRKVLYRPSECFRCECEAFKGKSSQHMAKHMVLTCTCARVMMSSWKDATIVYVSWLLWMWEKKYAQFDVTINLYCSQWLYLSFHFSVPIPKNCILNAALFQVQSEIKGPI